MINPNSLRGRFPWLRPSSYCIAWFVKELLDYYGEKGFDTVFPSILNLLDIEDLSETDDWTMINYSCVMIPPKR